MISWDGILSSIVKHSPCETAVDGLLAQCNKQTSYTKKSWIAIHEYYGYIRIQLYFKLARNLNSCVGTDYHHWFTINYLEWQALTCTKSDKLWRDYHYRKISISLEWQALTSTTSKQLWRHDHHRWWSINIIFKNKKLLPVRSLNSCWQVTIIGRL